MHFQNDRNAIDRSDRRGVTNEIEFQIGIERCVDCVCRACHEKRVSVCGRTQAGLGADIAARARSIFDNEWLAEPLRQSLPYKTCDDVELTAGRSGADQTYRSRRIGLRACDL